MALIIEQFTCRSDNFGVLVHDPAAGLTAAIDTPAEAPIRDKLTEKGWRLTHIFTTHHHGDHVEGHLGLKADSGCEILGPAAEADKIPGIDRRVSGGDSFAFGSAEVRVIDTPGHTLGHISYWLPGEGVAFTGDTLFAMGCGRVFEGTPEMMFASLEKLRALPDDTRVYCGHEYTETNARFALTVDPANADLVARYDGGEGSPRRRPSDAADNDRAREEDQPLFPRRRCGHPQAARPGAGDTGGGLRRNPQAQGRLPVSLAELSAVEVAHRLGLAPHPEGGWYRETFRDAEPGDGRGHSTAIYYLLAAGDRSHWHRVDAVEVWHHYAGAPLELSLSADGRAVAHHRLSGAIAEGDVPQVVVPRRCWQSAVSLGAWSLAGCTVAPGFVFSGFEMAPPDFAPGG